MRKEKATAEIPVAPWVPNTEITDEPCLVSPPLLSQDCPTPSIGKGSGTGDLSFGSTVSWLQHYAQGIYSQLSEVPECLNASPGGVLTKDNDGLQSFHN